MTEALAVAVVDMRPQRILLSVDLIAEVTQVTLGAHLLILRGMGYLQ